MQKITIACLDTERQAAIEQLRALGTIHVTPWKEPASRVLDELHKREADLAAVLVALTAKQTVTPARMKLTSADAALDAAVAAMALRRQGEETIHQAEKAIAQLRPWGSFRKEQLATMAERGLHCYPCVQKKSAYQDKQFGDVQKILRFQQDDVFFLVFSRKVLNENSLPLAPLPENTSIDHWLQVKNKAVETIRGANAQLAAIAKNHLKDLQELTLSLQNEIQFATARDSMDTLGKLAFLKGYVPTEKLEPVRQAARKNAWALRYEEIPEEDEAVPTSLKLPRLFQMAKAIFDFVGILPGYHEVDVSIVVMIFLSIFCGMLVGDAGYGALFAAASLYGLLHSQKEESRKGCQLLLMMSACIVIYGALTGTWFGMDRALLPAPLKGLSWFTNEQYSNAHVQLVCFFLGAIQMSLACAWRAVLSLKELSLRDAPRVFLGKLRAAIGQIGWGIYLWANFGLANLLIIDGKGIAELPPLYCWLFLLGFLIILVCGIDWTNMGDVIYMPFTFINCFVDVLSYIRLFAVGLSSMYIAQCFNNMGAQIYQLSPWLIPATILLLALGHILNIALACMGVLVHGIRLNTLEFSGHMNISWSGKPYLPLK